MIDPTCLRNSSRLQSRNYRLQRQRQLAARPRFTLAPRIFGHPKPSSTAASRITGHGTSGSVLTMCSGMRAGLCAAIMPRRASFQVFSLVHSVR
jgi:hypothetical protein